MEEIKCMFCGVESSKYSCPRCSLKYCSSVCYKSEKHLNCSESFFKEQVEQELKEIKGTSAEKMAMIKALVRNKDEAEKQEDTDEINKRLENVNINNTDELWGNLIEKEKEEFLRRLQTGNIDFIQHWKPWWYQTRSKVEDLSVTGKQPQFHPKIENRIKCLQDLLPGKAPNENICYSVVEITLVYVHTLQVHNGDLRDFPEDTVDMLFSSNSLSKNFIYSDTSSVIYPFLTQCEGDKKITKLEDLQAILSRKEYLLSAFSDLYRFFKWYRKHAPEDKHLPILYKGLKKVVFYLSYINENYEKSIVNCLISIKKIKHDLTQDKECVEKQKDVVEEKLPQIRSTKSCKLIQEIN